jgi:CheY-like chemotaxis protein
MSARVLVADDSAVVRLSVTRRVRALGLEVVEKDSVATAMTVDPGDFACALLDLDLGDGEGTEIAAHLAAGGGGLAIAFFSSTTTDDVLARARAFGPVFSKPDQLDQAIAWIEAHAR